MKILSDVERKKYQRFLENLHTEASIAQTLTLEAEERVEKRREISIAIKCIKRGDTNEQIVEITELTFEEVDQLRKEIAEGKH